MADDIPYLERLDPTRNIARFYAVELVTDLFGTILAVRRWGRIGTRGREKAEVCASLADAEASLARRLQTKRRRGYRIRDV